MKIQIFLIAENVEGIKIKSIILNAKIAKVNFARDALKIIQMFQIVLVHYVENNFLEEEEI